MADVGFVHLRVHSAYSLLEGALPFSTVIDLAAADGQPALAVTDTGNLFGALEFSEKAAGLGVQPIVGCSVAVDFHDVAAQERTLKSAALPRIVLLAMSEVGFANLVELVSQSWLDSDGTDEAQISLNDLQHHCDGLIALTGGPGGPLNMALEQGELSLAASRLQTLAGAFGDRLYIELQRHGLPTELATEPGLLDLAYAQDIPLVATNEAYFPRRDDYEAHDALICISQGRVIIEDDRRRLTAEHYFKSRAEMAALFADLPEAVNNTIEIALRCTYRPQTRAPILPRFSGTAASAEEVENGGDLEAQELRDEAWAGLAARLETHEPAPGMDKADYDARLEHELSVISNMQYAGYFLIVADFIKWAKAQGIPVGPGRGSGAGSLVAYALTITDLDPMRFDLLFERFLNPDRVSMPDFDIDFCQDRRDEVIRYVQDKYGVDQVAQIITFGTLQARAVLRDVGRVLQMPYGQVDRLCKMVPSNPANPVTLRQAIDEEPQLADARKSEEIVARLMDMSIKLEGLYRHASTHAAGIVIGDRPLSQLVPLYRDPRSDMPVTQYNMKWVEQAGLVKFDFLGLKTLTVLETAIDLIRRSGTDIDLETLPLDDTKSYDMLSAGETVGVFQLESAGMRKALVDMKPDRFEDIIALVALYRPGPMANIPTYCNRKHKKEKPDYMHPKLEPILKETFGVIIYQEQVMQIAQELSGYSLGEADLLRRAMGKKIKSEMDAQRHRFVDGAVERGLNKPQADAIFDLLARFADYGFNKSHAAAYALVAYQTAYLKANFPVEFLAASMTLDMGNTDKLSDFRRDAIGLGIVVEPPSVNKSMAPFDVRDGRIFYSLSAIKGVGQQAVDDIVAARGDRPFADLSDFVHRVSSNQINRRTLESLVAAGAFDDLEPDRARLTEGLDVIIGLSSSQAERRASAQDELFGGADKPEPVRLPMAGAWLPSERLHREFQAVGFYLSAHPLDEYGEILKREKVQMWTDFEASVRAGAAGGILAGTIAHRQERKTRKGGRMGILRVSDPTGQFEAVIFSEGLNQYREILEPGQSVIMKVTAENRQEGVNVRIQTVELIDAAAGRNQGDLRIFVDDPSCLESLKTHLDPRDGNGRVIMTVLLDGGASEADICLKDRYRVSPQIASALKAVRGVAQVEMA